jgi:gluconolactonase
LPNVADASTADAAEAGFDAGVADTGIANDAGDARDEPKPTDGGAAAEASPDAAIGAWGCPPGPFGPPIPPGAAPAPVAGVPPADAFNQNNTDHGNIEGPAWLAGSLYLSEMGPPPNPPKSRILRLAAGGAVSVAVDDSGSNGLATDRSGQLYAAVHKDGSVSRVDLAAGTMTPIVSSYMGARFNSPNDLAVRSDGTIYFSDPDYQSPKPAPQAKTRLYRIPPGATAVTVVDDTVVEPNGVTFSVDEATLYVTNASSLYAYPVMPDGSVGTRRTISSNVPNGDGMVIDCAGNLYVATKANVAVFDASGNSVGQLTAPSIGSVTNTAFGGADRKTLYMTVIDSQGAKALFSVDLAIPGMPY